MTNETVVPGTSRIVRRLSALLLAGVVFAGACEGDNLYSGDVSEYTPLVNSLSLPQVAFAGDDVTIRIDAAAARGISQIVLALRGAVQKDTVVELDEPLARVSQIVSIRIPQAVTDTLILVQAAVIDQYGDVSATREGTVIVFGPPTINSVLAPAIVQAGSLVSIRVSAFGARNISQIDLVTVGAVHKDTTVSVFPPRTNVTQDIVFSVPSFVQDTVIQLAVSARDELGAASPAKLMLVPMVIAPPTVDAIVPSSVQAGKILSVAVAASSARQISEVRVEIRGGWSQDLVVRLTPTRANALEYIDVPLPANLIVPELRVRAIALDRANVLSATEVFTVDAPTFAPVVSNVEPYAGSIYGGHIADLRVQALGDRPIERLRFRWRGFVTPSFDKEVLTGQTPTWAPKIAVDGPEATYAVTPPRLSVIEDIAVGTPCVRNDATFFVLVTAYDVDQNLSAVVQQQVGLTGNPSCADPVDVIPAPAPLIAPGSPSGILKPGGPSR
jgi:hypothetical protein